MRRTLRWLLLAPLLAAGVAHAEPEYSVLSTTATEVRPNLYGDFNARFRQGLAVRSDWGDGWRFDGAGALRLIPAPLETARLDFYRLAFDHRTSDHHMTIGRQVRHDVRGLQHLDGVNVDIHGQRAVSGSLYLGRFWTPANFDATVGTLVIGGQLSLRPMEAGRASKRTRFVLGYEARAVEEALRQRLLASASTYGPRGARGLVMAEVQPGPDRVQANATLSGGMPVGRSIDLALDLRWQDLRNPSVPASMQTPIEWLAKDGYGIATGTVSWRSGNWDLVARGGPSVRPTDDGASPGATGRVDLGYRLHGLTAGVYANSAGIEGTWVAGGGGVVGVSTDQQSLTADIGIYRVQPIDGASGTVWETRIQANTPLYKSSEDPKRTRVDLGLQFAGGADRQLAPWARAGAVLDVRTGGGR